MIHRMMPPTHWFPELCRLESYAERRALWNEAHKPISTNPVYWFSAFACMASGMAIVLILANPIGQWTVMHREWVVFWGSAATVLLTAYVTLWFVRDRIRHHLRRGLIERGHQLCLACGYDLTGNVSGYCAECGHHSGVIVTK